MWVNENVDIKCRSRIFLLGLLFVLSIPVSAQVNIFAVQDFSFGTFTHGGNGGTVILSPTGLRTATGDVVLLNSGTSESAAIFEIEAPTGSTISISNGPDATLAGSNGGSMLLQLGQTDPPTPINTLVSPPDRTRFQLGGTLVVGNLQASPPGTYSGSFSIIIHQE